MKLKILLLLFALPTFSTAQTLNLRKAILKSDLIISLNNYHFDTVLINDFTTKKYIKIDQIGDHSCIIYKNSLASMPKKLTLREFRDGEDFNSELITNAEDV